MAERRAQLEGETRRRAQHYMRGRAAPTKVRRRIRRAVGLPTSSAAGGGGGGGIAQTQMVWLESWAVEQCVAQTTPSVAFEHVLVF